MEILNLVVMISFHFFNLLAVVVAAVLLRPVSAKIPVSMGMFLLFFSQVSTTLFFKFAFAGLHSPDWLYLLVTKLSSLVQVVGWGLVLFGVLKLRRPAPKLESDG